MDKSPNLSRPDIVEGKCLEVKFNLESIFFEDAKWILHDFIQDVLISEGVLRCLNISPKIVEEIKRYNEDINDYLIGVIDGEAINQKGYEAWSLHDSVKADEKSAIAFVLAGLCDKKKAFYDEYGSSMHFQALFFNVYKLGGGRLCKKLREYIEQHPKMQKYNY